MNSWRLTAVRRSLGHPRCPGHAAASADVLDRDRSYTGHASRGMVMNSLRNVHHFARVVAADARRNRREDHMTTRRDIVRGAGALAAYGFIGAPAWAANPFEEALAAIERESGGRLG